MRRWIPVVLAAALVLGACSALEDTFGTMGQPLGGVSADADEMGGGPGANTADVADAGGGEDGSLDVGSAPSPSVDPVATYVLDRGRDIVFRADLTVAVADVETAIDEATTVVAGLGGFLFGQATTGRPDPRSVLTFKVPPDSFEAALSGLGRIGEVRSRGVEADDVTDRVVDLRSRIDTAAASVSRLRGLLDEATDIETIVALEGELLERETQLESLRGSLRTLEDQVDLATISLTLTEASADPALQLSVTAYPSHDDGLSCPGGGTLGVEQGAEATLCLEVTNVGDTWLAGFDVHDPVLDLDLEGLILVQGTLDEPIEPGESILLAAELVPTRDLRTRTTVSAAAVGPDGSPIDERPASVTVGVFIDAIDPGGIPTFTEGLEASLDFLVDLGAVLMVVAGALLPFVWLPIGGWFAWRWWRRRRTAAARGAGPVGEGEVTPERDEVPAG